MIAKGFAPFLGTKVFAIMANPPAYGASRARTRAR